jgi:hypothetical protein
MIEKVCVYLAFSSVYSLKLVLSHVDGDSGRGPLSYVLCLVGREWLDGIMTRGEAFCCIIVWGQYSIHVQ